MCEEEYYYTLNLDTSFWTLNLTLANLVNSIYLEIVNTETFNSSKVLSCYTEQKDSCKRLVHLSNSMAWARHKVIELFLTFYTLNVLWRFVRKLYLDLDKSWILCDINWTRYLFIIDLIVFLWKKIWIHSQCL